MNEQSDALTPDELIGSLRSLANDLRYEGDEQRSEWLRRCADSATAMRGLLKSANVIIGVNAEIEALAADELEALCNENDDLRAALSQIVGAVPVFGAEGGCFYEHFGAEGEHMGTEYVDPTAVIQRIDELARAALARTTGEQA